MSGRWWRWQSILGACLMAAYALPLYFPPAPLPFAEMTPGAALGERLFPGVPTIWLALRLLGVLAGALIIGSAVERRWPGHQLDSTAAPSNDAPGPILWALLLVVAAQAMAAFFVPIFPRPLQIAYAFGLLVPSFVLGLSALARGGVRLPSGGFWASAALVLAWAIWHGSTAISSPRSADSTDTILSLLELGTTQDPSMNLLTEGAHAGVSSLHLLPQGAGLFAAAGAPLTLHAAQYLNVFWTSVSALALGSVATWIVHPVAAPVAVAAFLFSPFTRLIPYIASPLYLGPLLVCVMLLLSRSIIERRSVAALAAFGVATGFGLSHPSTLLGCLLVAGVTVALAPLSKMPKAAIAIAALACFATVYPGLPSAEKVGAMRNSFTQGKVAWATVEQMLLGQRSPATVAEALVAGHGQPYDPMLGSILSPLVIPRTPLRLWGDTLYEPLAAGLAAIGLVLCLRLVRRSRRAFLLIALLAAGLVPAFLSTYDRTSLTRTLVAPVAIALLAAVGFEAIRIWLWPRWRPALASALVSTVIVVSGIAIFDRVNRQILPRSSTGIALSAVRDGPRALLLEHGGSQVYDWLRVRILAAGVPFEPIRVLGFRGPTSFNRLNPNAVEIIAWSQSLDSDRGPRETICRRWPAAKLFDLWDRAGLSRAYAASLRDPDWRPALPRAQWTMSECR